MQNFVTSDGERIYFRETGAGPPLILLHEWASSHRIWEPLVRYLEVDSTVYRWDARGHSGHALQGTEAPTVERMAKDFAEMMDHLQLKDAVVVGHSMGALTLWEYISQFDCKNLSRICIVDQSPRLVTNDTWTLGIYGNWPKERDLAFSTDLQIDFVETVIKLVTLDRNGKVHRRYAANSNTLRQMRAYLSTLDPGPLIGIWQSLTAADYRLILDRISVPALLIYGSKSNYYSVGTGKYVQRSMPLAELIVYEGADHFPHLFDPRQFIADLSQFLACR